MNITNNGIEYYYEENFLNDKNVCVILVHGICEHLKRYDNFRNYLNEKGYSTLQYDLQGHGQTSGKRGAIDHFYLYVRELDFFVDKVKKEHPEQKIIILGHSLGGLIVSLYSVIHPNKVDGFILSGAPTRRLTKVIPLFFLPQFIVKHMKVKTDYKFKLNSDLSNNQKSNEAYAIDLLVLDYFEANLIKQMFIRGTSYLLKHIWQLRSPILFLHGKDDPIVPVNHSLITYKKLNSQNKEIEIFANMKHELINEINNDAVYYTITDWLARNYG